MLNELIAVGGNELAPIERLKTIVASDIRRINAQAVAPSTAASCDKLRLEISNDIRDMRKKFALAEAEFLVAIKAKEAEIEEIIAPLEEANEEYWRKIKEAKAVKFQMELKERYYDGLLDCPDADGEVTPFHELYEPEWAKLTQAVAARKLIEKKKTLEEAKANKGKRWQVEVLFPSLDWNGLKEVEALLAKHSDAIEIERKEI